MLVISIINANLFQKKIKKVLTSFIIKLIIIITLLMVFFSLVGQRIIETLSPSVILIILVSYTGKQLGTLLLFCASKLDKFKL